LKQAGDRERGIVIALLPLDILDYKAVPLRFHMQLGHAASKRGNDNVRSPAGFENAPDSLLQPL
jgi:hypothetical protein